MNIIVDITGIVNYTKVNVNRTFVTSSIHMFAYTNNSASNNMTSTLKIQFIYNYIILTRYFYNV